jgi:integrase
MMAMSFCLRSHHQHLRRLWTRCISIKRARDAESVGKVCLAGFLSPVGCHTWRATGITIYLENDGRLEHDQQMAGHESPRTTKLYDQPNLDDPSKLKRSRATPQSSACTRANMIRLRHPLTPAAAAGLVLAALARGQA